MLFSNLVHGHARIDTASVTYTAAIETASTADLAKTLAPFVRRVEREALGAAFMMLAFRLLSETERCGYGIVFQNCFPRQFKF